MTYLRIIGLSGLVIMSMINLASGNTVRSIADLLMIIVILLGMILVKLETE